MGARTGVCAQFGFAEEDNWGELTAPDHWLPLVEESLEDKIDIIESAGIVACQEFMASDQWDLGNHVVGGDVKLEALHLGSLLFLKHGLGAAAKTGAGPYTWTITPAPLTGLGLSLQVGRPDISGTVQPFNFAGCKITKWELAGKAGENVTAGWTVAARAEHLVRSVTDGATTTGDKTLTSATAAFDPSDAGTLVSGAGIAAGTTIASVTSATEVELSANATATATGVTVTFGAVLGTATYPASNKPWRFLDGHVTVAGDVIETKDWTISGDNSLKTDRFMDGPLISEPLVTDARKYTGKVTVDFSDMTHYLRYRKGTEVAVVLRLARGADSVTITMNGRLDTAPVAVKGRDVLEQSLEFSLTRTALDPTAITIVAVTADSTL
jgi:hypothetical protein